MEVRDILFILLCLHALYTEFRFLCLRKDSQKLRQDGELLMSLIRQSTADNLEFIKKTEEFKELIEKLNEETEVKS